MAADHEHSMSHLPHNASISNIITSPTESVVEVKVPAGDEAPLATKSPSTAHSTSEVDISSQIDLPYDNESSTDQETISEDLSDTDAESTTSSTAYLNINRPGASQDDCLFLNKLPAEMRNNIYELVFQREDDTDRVWLHHAQPPSKILLLTCQQIRHEAIKPYKKAAHEYWTETQLEICTELMIEEGGEELIWQLEHDLWSGNNASLRHQNVDRICYIAVEGRNDIYGHFDEFTYLDDKGIWIKAEWRTRRDVFCWFQRGETEEWGYARRKKDALAAVRKTGTKALHEQLASLVRLAAVEWYDPGLDMGY